MILKNALSMHNDTRYVCLLAIDHRLKFNVNHNKMLTQVI